MTDRASPPKPRRRRWPWLFGAVLVVLGAPFAAAAWLVMTESGLRTAVALAQRTSAGQVVIDAPAGRLADAFRLGTVTVELPDQRIRIEEFALAWSPARLLDRRVEIGSLSIGAVDVWIRGDDGAPAAPPAPPVLGELPLALVVGRLTLGRLGVHAWSDLPVPSAEAQFALHDLEAALASDGRAHRIAGLRVALPIGAATLDGEIDGASAPHTLAAQGTLAGTHEAYDYRIAFDAAGDLRDLVVSVRATGAGLEGEAQVELAPFEAVPLRRLVAQVGEIDPAAFHPEAPRAALTINADLVPEVGDEWVLAGSVSIDNARPDSVDRGGIPLVGLVAELRWSATQTVVEGLRARLPGDGRIEGALDWRPDPAGESIGQLAAQLELAAIQVQRLDARLPAAVVAGRLDAQGDVARQEASVDLTIGAARVRGQGEFVPAGGEAAARVSARGALAAFDPSALVVGAPSARLDLDFEASAVLAETARYELAWQFGRAAMLEGRALGGAGRVVLEGERLAAADVAIELAGNGLTARGAWGGRGDRLAVAFDGRALDALGFDLSGRATLEGVVSGTRTEPAGELRLFAEALGLPGGVRIDGVNAQGRLEAGLDGPLHLSLGLSGLGDGVEARWLDHATLVVDGQRSAHRIDLHAIAAEDSVTARLDGELLEGSTAAGAAAWDGARWRGRLAALETTGRFPALLTEPAELTLARERIVLGPARLDAGDKGRLLLAETLWTPERIAARGTLTGLALQLAARDGDAERREERREARRARAASGDEGRAMGGDEGRDPTAPDEGEGGRRGRGPGELVLGAEWDLRLGDTAEADVRVFRESGDLAVTGDLATRIGLQQLEARLTARDNRLALSWEAAGTELGRVSGSVTALAERTADGQWQLAPDAALLGSAHLDMPSIAWLGRLLQEEIELGGSLGAAFSISGTPANPLGSGRIEGRELSVLLVEHGLQLSGGELRAEFDRDRLRLTRLEFVSPNRVRPRERRVPVDEFVRTPGRLSASGDIALESGNGYFTFQADRLPILQRPDRWLILSGSGEARSTWTSLALEARLGVDSGYFELAESPPPSLSDDVVILGAEEAEAGGGLKVSADVLVLLGDRLYLSALGVDTRLTGELRLRLREGEPLTAVGTIATVGGSYRGFGQNLTIERGLINFQGALDNPGLNIVALRKGLAVEAGIAVAGSARRPQIRLVSEPDVPDPDKLSWIVLGRAPTAGAGADMGLLLPAAQALLGGSGGGMTDQLSRSLGFDEFGIGQGELGAVSRRPTSRVVGGGSTTEDATVSGQVLTLGKRLSSDLFLSFEQSLGGAESLVRLTYQLSRRVSVVVRGGTDNSADVYYTISFR